MTRKEILEKIAKLAPRDNDIQYFVKMELRHLEQKKASNDRIRREKSIERTPLTDAVYECLTFDYQLRANILREVLNILGNEYNGKPVTDRVIVTQLGILIKRGLVKKQEFRGKICYRKKTDWEIEMENMEKEDSD